MKQVQSVGMLPENIKGDQLKLFVLPDGENIFHKNSEAKLLKLEHPKTKEMCFFITVKFEERTTLYELKNQYEDPSSWFIGNTLVKSDGSLNIVTRYDPLYLLLPKMIEVSKDGKFHLIDQIESENFELIVSCLKSNKQLEKICDLSEAGEYRAYRYSEEKTMEWLKAKALNIANSLSDNNFLVLKLNGPINDETDSKSQVRCAWGMLSDYISVDLSEKLRSKLEIPKKCKIIFGSKNACKEVTATEDYSNTIETKKYVVKEGSLKRKDAKSKTAKKVLKPDEATKKTRSMMSFFKPVAKK